MTIKIGLAGTHSTGKSSFLARVEHRLAEIGLTTSTVGDLATAAQDCGFPILRDHTAQSTAWIIATGIARELDRSRDADVLLVDRPVADALGYYYAALEHRAEAVDPEDGRYLLDLVRVHSSTYDVLLRTEIDESIPIDTSKKRDLDARFRQLASSGIETVFSQLDLDHRVLRPATESELLEAVVAIAERR